MHIKWNISDRMKKTKDLDTGIIEQTSLSSDVLASIATKDSRFIRYNAFPHAF